MKIYLKIFLDNADKYCIMKAQENDREKDKKMEKVQSVNGFISSLPKIRKRRIWKVIINGTVVQGVSADDNRKSTAQAYIASKYPGQAFTLEFSHWKI